MLLAIALEAAQNIEYDEAVGSDAPDTTTTDTYNYGYGPTYYKRDIGTSQSDIIGGYIHFSLAAGVLGFLSGLALLIAQFTNCKWFNIPVHSSLPLTSLTKLSLFL